MPEIQSAEAFANLIWRCKETIEEDDKDLVFDIRTRDKAIVERIKAVIMADSEPHTMIRQSYVCELCDDVLREIGGE